MTCRTHYVLSKLLKPLTLRFVIVVKVVLFLQWVIGQPFRPTVTSTSVHINKIHIKHYYN